MVEHERFTKGSSVEERKWLESAVEVVQAIQEPEDITITDVVFHSRQENAVEPHEHGTPQHKSRQGCSEFLAENNCECLWLATIYALSKQIFSLPCQISPAYNYTYHLFSKTCSIYRSVASVEYSVYVDQSVIKQGYYIILTLTLHSDNTFIVSLVIIYLSSVTLLCKYRTKYVTRGNRLSATFFIVNTVRAEQHDLRTRNFRGL